MNTAIEIVRVDEENQKGFIIAMSFDLVVVKNTTLGIVQWWDLEDLKQCIKFV